MTHAKNDQGASAREKLNAELSKQLKAIQLQKTQVEFLMEAARAVDRAEVLNKMIDKASDLGMTQDEADVILTKSFGMGTLDIAKVAIGYRLAAGAVLKKSRALDAQIDALKIGAE